VVRIGIGSPHHHTLTQIRNKRSRRCRKVDETGKGQTRIGSGHLVKSQLDGGEQLLLLVSIELERIWHASVGVGVSER